VDSSYILSTINPVVGLLFALTFLLIWRQQPHSAHILSWSLGFAAGSVGFAFEFFHYFIPYFQFANGVNIFLPVSVLFSVRGLCLRYTGRAPDRLLLSITTLTGIFAIWISFVDQYALGRGLLISSGIALMLTVGMHSMMGLKTRDKIDLGIFSAISLLTIMLLARPFASFLIEGAPKIDAIKVTSFWAVSLKVMGLYAWLVFAILFMLRIAADLLAELQKQSITDSLSGILNRGGFLAAAESVVLAATPTLPVSVLLLDIDHFKKVNDNYGHRAGDQVIREMAKLMRSSAPESAIIGRLGGEEFAMVLPNTSSAAAFAFGEALRASFGLLEHAGFAASHPVTVSIGLVEGTGGCLEDLIHEADVALYKAKDTGRNQVIIAGKDVAGAGHRSSQLARSR